MNLAKFPKYYKKINRNNEDIIKKYFEIIKTKYNLCSNIITKHPLQTNIPSLPTNSIRLGHSLPTCCIWKHHFRAVETNKRIVFPP